MRGTVALAAAAAAAAARTVLNASLNIPNQAPARGVWELEQGKVATSVRCRTIHWVWLARAGTCVSPMGLNPMELAHVGGKATCKLSDTDSNSGSHKQRYRQGFHINPRVMQVSSMEICKWRVSAHNATFDRACHSRHTVQSTPARSKSLHSYKLGFLLTGAGRMGQATRFKK